MILTDEEGYALPGAGAWERLYLRDWLKAFPQSFEKPGHHQGKTWVSATPAWDTWWFEIHGVKPPRKRVYRSMETRNTYSHD